MNHYFFCAMLCILLIFPTSIGQCTPFDERLWEKYTEISSVKISDKGLAGVYIEPDQFGDVTTKIPFADLRVVTDYREEIPWQIVVRRPENRSEEIPALMRNLSQTKEGDTWLELQIEKPELNFSAIEIITHDTDFSRQVQLIGSRDGKTWNTIRNDGVIFDIPRGEKLHRTRIAFPTSSFRLLALKIANGGAKPLNISRVKVFRDNTAQGQVYSINGTNDKPEINTKRQETSIVVRMNTVFPLERLIINTTERNFQRSVEVQVKGKAGDWERWAEGTIFSFDTATMRESQLFIDMPEIATKEFRLVFRNFDSPPLTVTTVTGNGYRIFLVFKKQPERNFYLFWGNPLAQMPKYDLAKLIARQKLDEIPISRLGEVRPNAKFAGNNARLPFSERYKYLLFGVIIFAIIGLMALQYRVFKRVQQRGTK